MTCTAEHRAEVSRANGRKSRGPTSDEGKARSRMNAFKHGLRAEVVPLPGEDPEAVEARERAWNDYYRPESPAAQHLVNQCVEATLLADRVNAYHAEALGKQVREADKDWLDAREAEVAEAARSLATDPEAAVARLTRSAAGCRYLLGRWEELADTLRTVGHWIPSERDEAIRLSGHRAEFDRLSESATAFEIRLFNLLSREHPSPKALDDLLREGRMPADLKGVYARDSYPDREDCRRTLANVAAERVSVYRERLAELAGLEAADRAAARARALVLKKSAEARLFLRYRAEARTSFHRAYSELVKVLDRDRAEGPAPAPPAEPESPKAVEAVVSGPEAAQVASPNEPSRGPWEVVPVASSDPFVPAVAAEISAQTAAP